MRPTFFYTIALLGLSKFAGGQAVSSDAQTLQALLTEVRALRQELRMSLNRTQTMQILLVRFQAQEEAVTRASDRLNDARQKLVGTHVHQKELTTEVQRLEDAMNASQNPQQQADFQDRIRHVKTDLEIAGGVAQKQQTTEIEAQQQLRDEQDKLNALESQMDELIRAMGSSIGQPSSSHP
jgi:DNA repair exonuclease SbcCD ATPase subunit